MANILCYELFTPITNTHLSSWAISFSCSTSLRVSAIAARSLTLNTDSFFSSKNMLLTRCFDSNSSAHWFTSCARRWNRHIPLPVSSFSCAPTLLRAGDLEPDEELEGVGRVLALRGVRGVPVDESKSCCSLLLGDPWGGELLDAGGRQHNKYVVTGHILQDYMYIPPCTEYTTAVTCTWL